MTERPIIFSAPMVRAILAGTKTQTRRAVKPQPIGKQRLIEGLAHVTKGMNPADDGAVWYVGDCVGPGVEVRCPYGAPGDRLWVRETFYCDHKFYPEGTPANVYWDGDKARKSHTPEQIEHERKEMRELLDFRADGEPEWEGSIGTPWRPSIHMPRWASRITLEVVGVRVERLQEITEADVRAEGVDELLIDGRAYAIKCRSSAMLGFSQLWDSINAKRHPWTSNPFVWVVEFKVAEVRRG